MNTFEKIFTTAAQLIQSGDEWYGCYAIYEASIMVVGNNSLMPHQNNKAEFLFRELFQRFDFWNEHMRARYESCTPYGRELDTRHKAQRIAAFTECATICRFLGDGAVSYGRSLID